MVSQRFQICDERESEMYLKEKEVKYYEFLSHECEWIRRSSRVCSQGDETNV